VKDIIPAGAERYQGERLRPKDISSFNGSASGWWPDRRPYPESTQRPQRRKERREINTTIGFSFAIFASLRSLRLSLIATGLRIYAGNLE
jgi:hypothetical protein